MPDYDNTNRFALFTNKFKKQNEKAPDFQGPLNVICPHCANPIEKRLSGWKRLDKASNPMVSGQVQDSQEEYEKKKQQQQLDSAAPW